MGLVKAFTRRRPQQSETRAITEFAIIDGVAVDGSGETGTRYRGGMSIPGAWRASLLISDLLGSVPWDAYKQRRGNRLEQMSPTPPLLDQPTPPDTRMNTVSSFALDLLWNGNAVGIWAARDSGGYPTAVLPVPAEQVGVRRVTETSYSPLPIGSIEYSIGSLTFAPWEVLHVKGPCAPGALRGMGVLENHMTGGALGLAREQMRQASNLANHGVPTGYIKNLKADATEADLTAMKAAWLRAQRDRTVAVLNTSAEFTPLSWNPEEMQLVEARRYTLTDLENIFGLPVGWLGGMNSARQYSNIEQDAVNLIKFTLSGHLARFEQALSLAFPRDTMVKANLDAVLRADTKTRYEAHEIGIRAGFLTTDEVRELEDRPPVPEADEGLPDARNIAEMVQKIYLGVGKVITVEEARQILRDAGAAFPAAPPDELAAPSPAPVPPSLAAVPADPEENQNADQAS